MPSSNLSSDSPPSDSADFLPTADLTTLRRRADLLAEVRAFFTTQGYWEVETPVLSHDFVVDAHLEPFALSTANGSGATGDELFLQTSPEFGMKRLLAAGADKIFQITRAFRRGERGRYHNPEFTMIEWYRVGDTHIEQMDFVEKLVAHVFRAAESMTGSDIANRLNDTRRAAILRTPYQRFTYDEAFERFTGTRVLSLSTHELIELARINNVIAPESLSRDDGDGWLNLLLAELVEPKLSADGPAFLYDYPASQSALARVRREQPPVAERFELYIAGIELCNGYHELADPAELRERMRVQAQIRAADGRRTLPDDNRLLAAMEAGLPNCSGVALGFDRLAMLALGVKSLAEVIAFPFDRA